MNLWLAQVICRGEDAALDVETFASHSSKKAHEWLCNVLDDEVFLDALAEWDGKSGFELDDGYTLVTLSKIRVS